jgi:hypothetical protein
VRSGAGDTEASSDKQAAKNLESPYELYGEGDVVALQRLAAEAASLADRSTGRTRRRAMSVAEEARLYVAMLAAGTRPPPVVAGRGEDSALTPATGAVFGGVLGFVVGLLVGIPLGADAGDIPSLNALVDVFYGVIGLVIGAVAGLLVGLVLRNRARSHRPTYDRTAFRGHC